MFKWLEKFKFKTVKQDKTELKPNPTHFCLEIRVDEKGLVYYPTLTNPYLELDPEGYSEICQTMASIALTEMREKNRTLH